MEVFPLIILILFIWGIARVLGRVFDGPRYRRRKARREYRRMQEYARYDAYITLKSMEDLRRRRRDRW